MVFIIFLFGKNGSAQTEVNGKINDRDTGIDIFGANIQLFRNGIFIQCKITGVDGNYRIRLDEGTYYMEVSNLSYPTQGISEIVVREGQITLVDVQLFNSGGFHDSQILTHKERRVVKCEKMEKGQRFIENTLKEKPDRKIKEIIMMTPGVTFDN